MGKVDFDDYVREYDALLRKEVGFFSKDDLYFAAYKVRITREQIDFEPARILEFGCGIGRNIPFLRSCFPSAEVHGSDVSAKSLEWAERNNPGAHFFIDDGTETVLPDYDLVFVAGVLHHILPVMRNDVLARIGGRLRPRGQVVLFEHNPYNPITRRIVSSCPFDADAVLLSMRDLRSRLIATGFTLRKKGYALFFPERLGALAGADRFLRWLPLGGQYFVVAEK
jgi:SAM-dependent methyltransferase